MATLLKRNGNWHLWCQLQNPQHSSYSHLLGDLSHRDFLLQDVWNHNEICKKRPHSRKRAVCVWSLSAWKYSTMKRGNQPHEKANPWLVSAKFGVAKLSKVKNCLKRKCLANATIVCYNRRILITWDVVQVPHVVVKFVLFC